MTITNYTDLELRLQAEIAALKARLFEMQNAAIAIKDRLVQALDESKELKAKLAEYEKQEPVGWATVAQLKRGAFIVGAKPSYMDNLIPLYTKGTP